MAAPCDTPLELYRYFSGSDALTQECVMHLTTEPSLPSYSLTFYALVFLFTCALELPFYWAVLRPSRASRRLSALILCNLATHPAVCFLFPRIAINLQKPIAVEALASEIFAPVVETILLWKLWHVRWWEAAIIVFAANLFSWWLGGIAVYELVARFM